MPSKVEKLKKTTPELRFPGFDGEWEEKKMGEVIAFLKGKGISKDDIIGDGVNKCIRYGELYTEYGEVVQKVVSLTNVPAERSLESKFGDVMIPSSGETAWDIAVASCILEDGVLLGGDMNVLRPSHETDGIFLAYYLSNGSKRNIARLAQGNSVVHLYSSYLRGLKLLVPTLREQKKIADFLGTIDEWIENLKAQKREWEAYKKGMMQKIFSQEIRFKDEDGNEFPDWEEKKLGRVSEINPSSSALPEEFNYVDLESVDKGILSNPIKLQFDVAPSRAQRVLKRGDILFQTVRPYQQNNLFFDLDGDYVASTGYAQLRTKQVPQFWFQYIHSNNFLRKVLSRCTGTNYPAINSSDLKGTHVQVPDLAEQKKIAGFLSSVDDLINSHQEKITRAEEWKKGLMQRMFV
ncbi:MAG TPA: restriction endonuclease subunit S [Bdellovibrionota bacterium]|nr:restriction endonuclease subunit S [Bdellovibrionota bacterium]